MGTSFGWRSNFQAEIDQAAASRAQGNEGRARVCARRAAGIVAGEYFQRRGIDFRNPSAYERLKFLAELPEAGGVVVAAAARLLQRVNEDYDLPQEADLIAEACSLAQALLGEVNPNQSIDEKGME